MVAIKENSNEQSKSFVMSNNTATTPLSELKDQQTDRIGKMRDIKSQIGDLMTRLDQESKTLLSSFSQLQPDNDVEMTMHSLTGLLPQNKKAKAAFNLTSDDKENEAAVNIDANNYLTLGDLQRVEPSVSADVGSPYQHKRAKSSTKSPETRKRQSSAGSHGRITLKSK